VFIVPAPGFYSFWIRSLGAGIFIFFTLGFQVFADNGNYPAGARSAGVSNASVTLTDAWCTFNNQAGLGFLSSPTAGFYFENRFLVKELSMQAGTFAMPFKPGALALSYRYFGYSKYYESKFGLAYGHKFTKRFAAGVQMNYLQTHLSDGYGNYNAVAAEIGILAQPVDHFYIGAHVFNPTMTNHQSLPEARIPTVFRFGVSYRFEGKGMLLFETEKDMEMKPAFKGGIEIQAIDNLFFRGGFSTVYERYSFGIGYKYRKLVSDLAFSHHDVLGFTPHVSVGYEF
jgi:hypothetical protein